MKLTKEQRSKLGKIAKDLMEIWNQLPISDDEEGILDTLNAAAAAHPEWRQEVVDQKRKRLVKELASRQYTEKPDPPTITAAAAAPQSVTVIVDDECVQTKY